jgi:hypothetical protein
MRSDHLHATPSPAHYKANTVSPSVIIFVVVIISVIVFIVFTIIVIIRVIIVVCPLSLQSFYLFLYIMDFFFTFKNIFPFSPSKCVIFMCC